MILWLNVTDPIISTHIIHIDILIYIYICHDMITSEICLYLYLIMCVQQPNLVKAAKSSEG